MCGEKTQFKKGHIPWKKGRFKEKKYKDCEVCFSPFAKSIRLSLEQWKNAKYCNRVCLGIAFSKSRMGVSRGKHSFEARKRMSLSSIGKVISPATRRKISMTLISKNSKGEKNPNWKGGITPENHKIRTSPEYVSWRKKVFARDCYSCQACARVGGKLHADHELPFALYPDLRFEVLNGRTLCAPCHRKIPTNNKAWKLPEFITAQYV